VSAVSRRAAAVSALVLVAVLLAVAAVLVPWTPLPGASGHVDVLRDFTPAQLAREDAFHAALRPWSYASLALGLVVAAVLGLTPLGARLVAAVARPLGGGWAWRVVLGTLAVAVVGRVVTLPLDVRAETVLRAYGLSSQTWGSWTADAVKGALVNGGLTALGLLAVVGLARRLPRTWWAWGAGAVAALVVAGSFAYPLVIEPVFNSFTPLPAGQLRTDLLDLAARDSVPVSDVLVADASRRTTALNAYVSGFGPSRRIVLYDTLVKHSSPQEVELIVAHELGHAKRDDVLTGTALGALGSAAGVCLLALVLSWAPLLRRAGVDGPGDGRVVALLALLVAVSTLATSPATNLVSRRIEARADVHSLDLTRDPATFRASQVRLAVTNLSDLDPSPLVYAFFSDHPTGPQRLLMAREWERLRGGR
jgi:STE24 endopeptidase